MTQIIEINLQTISRAFDKSVSECKLGDSLDGIKAPPTPDIFNEVLESDLKLQVALESPQLGAVFTAEGQARACVMVPQPILHLLTHQVHTHIH